MLHKRKQTCYKLTKMWNIIYVKQIQKKEVRHENNQRRRTK